MMTERDHEMKAMESINHLTEEAHRNALEHGFYAEAEDILSELVDPEQIRELEKTQCLAKLALIDSEVGEAVHAVQHGDKENLYEEMCDIIIRVLDMAGWLNINLGARLIAKMEYNRTRPYKHGKEC